MYKMKIFVLALAAVLGSVGLWELVSSTASAQPYGYYPVPYHRYDGYGRRHYSRGFRDPGYAYHGNIPGCASDLGYGRWEPCDAGR
jgi:hypothetical protein